MVTIKKDDTEAEGSISASFSLTSNHLIPSNHFNEIYFSCPWLITNLNEYAKHPDSMMLKAMLNHDLDILHRSSPKSTYEWVKHIIDSIEVTNG